MEKEQFRSNAMDMLYLTRCAVNGEVPDKKKISQIDLDCLFIVCQKHILTACVAYALETAGIRNHDFIQAKEKAIRKNILLDAERRKILNRLEQEHIWYMPLKGALLKDWYPKLGMRQMSDNDILCDKKYRARIKEIMLDMGFRCDHFESGNDDAYFKEPVCNFEMHSELFAVTHVSSLYKYYTAVKERLLKDENNAYGYHFSPEDFYIYITAHEYKHCTEGGTGVRTLLDTYIFMKKFDNILDWSYINAELEKLEITEFEQGNRRLAMKFFSGEKLTKEETERLDYYIFSGTYGSIQNKIDIALENNSKSQYFFRRIFPTTDQLKTYWPFFYRHKWLLPVLWIYRPIRGLLFNTKKVKAEMKYLNKK